MSAKQWLQITILVLLLAGTTLRIPLNSGISCTKRKSKKTLISDLKFWFSYGRNFSSSDFEAKEKLCHRAWLFIRYLKSTMRHAERTSSVLQSILIIFLTQASHIVYLASLKKTKWLPAMQQLCHKKKKRNEKGKGIINLRRKPSIEWPLLTFTIKAHYQIRVS